METVGVNVTHDASFCRCVNGEINLFIEEERLSRKKHDTMPVKTVMEYQESNFAGVTGLEYHDYSLKDTCNFFDVIFKKKIPSHDYRTYDQHHFLHAMCGFYNSEFEEADVVVVDGLGNFVDEENHECATRWHIKKPAQVKLLERQGASKFGIKTNSHAYWSMGIGMAYASISDYLGFGQTESGKVMGLAPYGKEDPNIKPFVIDGRVNSKLFYRTRYGANFIPYDYLPEKVDVGDQRFMNLAYRLQKDFEKWMTDFILKCESKNIVLTGGCALNCVANYEYLKHLPKDVKLYIEPVSSDAGTSIGLAKYMYYSQL